MHLFERIGYVKTKKKVEGIFVEKSTKCVHLSHAEDHPQDTYRMCNPMTRAVVLTQNVTWAAWKPSMSHDTLEHFFETNPDGITDQENNIEDIKWADGRPAPHVIPDDESDAYLSVGRITQPDVEVIPSHLAGRRNGDRNGDRTGNKSGSEDDEAERMQADGANVQEDNNADNTMTEDDQDPPITAPIPPNAISAKSRKVASAMRKLQARALQSLGKGNAQQSDQTNSHRARG
jgi:hypothetical protein